MNIQDKKLPKANDIEADSDPLFQDLEISPNQVEDVELLETEFLEDEESKSYLAEAGNDLPDFSGATRPELARHLFHAPEEMEIDLEGGGIEHKDIHTLFEEEDLSYFDQPQHEVEKKGEALDLLPDSPETRVPSGMPTTQLDEDAAPAGQETKSSEMASESLGFSEPDLIRENMKLLMSWVAHLKKEHIQFSSGYPGGKP